MSVRICPATSSPPMTEVLFHSGSVSVFDTTYLRSEFMRSAPLSAPDCDDQAGKNPS